VGHGGLHDQGAAAVQQADRGVGFSQHDDPGGQAALRVVVRKRQNRVVGAERHSDGFRPAQHVGDRVDLRDHRLDRQPVWHEAENLVGRIRDQRALAMVCVQHLRQHFHKMRGPCGGCRHKKRDPTTLDSRFGTGLRVTQNCGGNLAFRRIAGDGEEDLPVCAADGDDVPRVQRRFQCCRRAVHPDERGVVQQVLDGVGDGIGSVCRSWRGCARQWIVRVGANHRPGDAEVNPCHQAQHQAQCGTGQNTSHGSDSNSREVVDGRSSDGADSVGASHVDSTRRANSWPSCSNVSTSTAVAFQSVEIVALSRVVG
jgi:hypothetical protein